jgi:hypothetical protein
VAQPIAMEEAVEPEPVEEAGGTPCLPSPFSVVTIHYDKMERGTSTFLVNGGS